MKRKQFTMLVTVSVPASMTAKHARLEAFNAVLAALERKNLVALGSIGDLALD